nr:unnamed protein product [Callosobruchus analis]
MEYSEEIFYLIPLSYLVDRGHSTLTNPLTKKRNRLDIISQEDLRLNVTIKILFLLCKVRKYSHIFFHVRHR